MHLKIDHDQVRAMLKNGIGPTKIAQRLGCSARQVIRIKKELCVSLDKKIDQFLDTPVEWDLWYALFLIHRNYSEVARRFGVSRQAIQERLSKREAA